MKEVDFNTIWTVPIYLPSVQPKLTDKIIQDGEIKIGYKFPKEYLDILEIQNGGDIRFTLKGTPHNQILGIGEFDKSITNFEWFKEYEEGLNFKLDGLFPFDGDGHWNICLDYRNNILEPEITYIDTEIEFEKPITKTFKDYLSLLEIETENRFAIETDLTIENFIPKISMLLNIVFEKPNSFDYGYKTYRSKYLESWIWVSSNKVPSGFVRENHINYEELKLIKITEKLRYPEVPENCLLMTMSHETERKEILKTLELKGIKVTELKTYFATSPNG